MKRLVNAGYAGLVAVLLAGCATTEMNSTWKAPDAQPVSFSGQKVVALVLIKSEAEQRVAEESLAKELTLRGVEGIPAYTLASGNDLKDKARAKAVFAQKGIEGIVIMRPVGRESKVDITPATWSSATYSSYWTGYYGVGYGGIYDPGYVNTRTIVTVETLVYSLKQDKLVWAGTSETTDPEKISTFVCDLAKAVTSAMEKDGMLAGLKK